MLELSDQDREAIEMLHHQWIVEELAGNATEVIELCTEDVKWIPPNSPPLETKDAISRYLKANSVDLKGIQIKDLEIRGSDKIAFLIANYCARFSVEGETQPQESTGTHLWVLRKTAEGGWLVAAITWNSWR
jgi:uncharacterized protein (TIGR02246 family)